MQNLKNEKWYSIRELSDADWFPYKYSSIRKFISSGQLEAKKFSPRRIMVSETAVYNFFKPNEQHN